MHGTSGSTPSGGGSLGGSTPAGSGSRPSGSGSGSRPPSGSGSNPGSLGTSPPPPSFCPCNCPTLDTRCLGDLDVEPCTCTPHALETQPPLGSGETPFNQVLATTVLSSNQEQIFQATPSNTFTSTDESSCCSCENSLNHAGVNATKVRKFGIHGDICVTECIQYVENGCAEEASRGSSKKNSIHVETP